MFIQSEQTLEMLKSVLNPSAKIKKKKKTEVKSKASKNSQSDIISDREEIKEVKS